MGGQARGVGRCRYLQKVKHSKPCLSTDLKVVAVPAGVPFGENYMSHGKVALITGGGSGVGRATALAFLEDGYNVALAGRRGAELEQTIARAGETPGDGLSVPTDVTDPDAVDALMMAIKDRWGRLDVVFNNAGVNSDSKVVGDVEVEEWKRVIDINLNGAFYIARGAFNLMRAQKPQGGRIINNGSISAHVPRWGSSPYAASKHAITGLTRSLSLDGRPFEIACGQIDIGNTASEMTSAMSGGVPQADGSLKSEPTMDISNVAGAVLHMAGMPLNANVQFMTIMATNMPFVGRG